ncbi:MAG: hypothetical protein JWO46_1620, partial [Nocardioidaceae bacterium]|nr:hypothetical protein [Nocardioidaceae bacterium]
MLLTKVIAGAAVSVAAAAVLAGPADAAASAQTGVATVAQQGAAGSHVAARKRVRTQVAVTITPSGTTFYDIAGT